MATNTERFGFTLPSGQDPASIIPLNLNTQNIEKYLGMTQDMLAPLYDATEGTYEVDDIVTHDSVLYKCITAVETPEAFDETKWVPTTATQEGGGASNVEANPTGTPTDTLSTISIDGTIFDIEGSGGSGSGYTETTLWSGSVTPSSSETVTLDSSLSNYDFIAFEATISGNNGCLIYPASYIRSLADIVGCFSSASSIYGNIWIQAIDNMSISLKKAVSGQNVTYTKIVGIKIESSGGSISGEGVEIYSEDEYIVGKWIDGKKLYQRTFSLPSAIILQANDWTTINNVVVQDANRCIQTDVYLGADDSQSSVFGKFSNGVLSIFSDIQLSINAVTVRYTKTVETPAPAWGGSVTNNYANFIDTDNVIQAETQVNSGTTGTYTATEDCYIRAKLWRSSEGGASLSIDGVEVLTNYSNSGTTALYNTIPLKKGQIATIDAGAGSPCSYTVYGITYASGGSSSGSSVDYSTEEKEVGTWIDGSKVYEKTIQITSVPDNTSATLPTPSDLQYLIDAEGFIYSSSSPTNQRLVPFSGGDNNDIRIDLNAGSIRIMTFNSWADYTGYLKIRYTKAVS